MALRGKVLLKKSEKFELKESQKIRVNQERLSALEGILDHAYLIRRPKSSDYHHRRELVRVFNEIAKDLYGNSNDCPVVEEFGSFLMDLFSTGSDLDLSVNFHKRAIEFPRDQKIKTLRKFARKFFALERGGHVSGVSPILSAKVPILKVVDSGTGIECDLSVENRDGILKSQIVHLVSSLDERFQKLSFLMKAWAKAHDINSSKDRTLNSLSIILLVAFHLQTRDPPILPPFSAILKDGMDIATVEKSVKKFLKYGKRNTESLAELFVSFLMKLSSVEKLWPKGICASTYQGAWISKTWDSKVGVMSVEDFTERSQNVARAVGKSEVEKIYKCIQLSVLKVSDFMDGRIQVPMLMGYLFGDEGIKVEPIRALPVRQPQPSARWPTPHQIITSNPISTKRKLDEAWQGTPVDNLTKHVRYSEGWEGVHREPMGVAVNQGWGRWEEPPKVPGWEIAPPPTGNWRGSVAQGREGRPMGSWGSTHLNASVCRSQELQPSTYQHFALADPSGRPMSRTIDRVAVHTLPCPPTPPVCFPPPVVHRY